MKKYMNLCLKFMISILLLLSLSTPAFCSGNALLLQKNYIVRRNEIDVFMSGEITDSIPDAGQFSFTLGGEELGVKQIKTTAEISVTYYCMVDITGLSQNTKLFNLEKDILQAICDGMSGGDRMVIATLGETLTPSEVMSEKDVISDYISSLEGTGEHTNLYQGIVSALNDLSTIENEAGENETDRKCLIILSDGQDYYYDSQHESTSKGLADDTVRSSRIPVYTVAILDDSRRDSDSQNWRSQMDLAAVLGTFAQESLSGVPYNPVNEEATGAQIAQRIMEDMKHDLFVALDLNQFSTIKDIPELEVRFETTEHAVYRDSITISAKDLIIEADMTLTERLLHDPEFLWLRVTVPIIIVLTVVLLALLLSGKRKKKILQDSSTESAASEEAVNITMPIMLPETDPGADELLRPVIFTAVGSKAVRIELNIPENREVVLGRNQRADFILNPEDTRLSSRHCRVLLQGRTLRVWDEGSSNGTSVDGVPLNKNVSVLLVEGQILWVGSYQYRVTFP